MITLTTERVDKGQRLTMDNGTFFGMIYRSTRQNKKPWQFVGMSPLAKIKKGPWRATLQAAQYDALAWAEDWAN